MDTEEELVALDGIVDRMEWAGDDRLLNRLAVSDDYRAHVPAEHRALVAALRARAAERAAAMFGEHLYVSYRRPLAETGGRSA